MKSLLPAAIAILLVLNCCKKDQCHGHTYESLGQKTKNNIPYQNGQIVSFKTNQSTTFNASVKRSFEVLKFEIPLNCEEYAEVDLTCTDCEGNFMQFILRGCCGGDSIVQVAISSNRNGRSNIFQYNVKPDSSMQSTLLTGSSIFHDTLTIDGKPYNKVLEVLQPDWLDPQDIIQLFYNSQYGVIGFKTRNGLIISRL